MTSAAPSRPHGVVATAPLAVVVLTRLGAELRSWPMHAERVDLDAVDRLARMQRAARRHGCSIALRCPSEELVGLIELAGLTSVIPVEAD